MQITGKAGELRCGGRVAARLTDWELVRSGDQSHLTAVLLDADDYYLEHVERFDVLLVMGNRVMVWKDRDIARNGSAISVQLGGRHDS